MPFQIIRNDITKVHVDAIVNTANPEPVYASGTDGAVYMAAGADQLLKERRRIGQLRTGEAIVTKAFQLPAKYIIHTVGPSWWDGSHGEFEDLASCYRKSLYLAEQLGCKSIAFPLISTGVYGFPKDRALEVALKEISGFLSASDAEMDVFLVVFDRKAYDLSASLIDDVRNFIDENYVAEKEKEEYLWGSADVELADRRERRRTESKPNWELPFPKEQSQYMSSSEALMRDDEEAEDEYPYEEMACSPALPSPAPFHVTGSLADVMQHVGETFQEHLFRLIDERGLSDATVYKKANLDRKLFSKIRCNANYKPQKKTVLALAVALELSLDETTDLLRSAELALSPGSKGDLIIVYCIEHRIYDVIKINSLLFDYGQIQLGTEVGPG